MMDQFVQSWASGILNMFVQGGVALGAALVLSLDKVKLPPIVKVWTLRLALLKLISCLVVTGGIAVAQIHSRPVEAAGVSPILQACLYTACALWFVSIGFGVARCIRSGRVLKRLVDASSAISDEHIAAAYAALCRRTDVAKPPALLLSAHVGSPMLLRKGKPAIMLPTSLIESGDGEGLRAALAHELAHHKRSDLLFGWIPVFGDLMCYLHPMLKLALKRLRLQEECAADLVAMRAVGATPPTYARTLLTFAEAGLALPGTCAMADSATELYRRIATLYGTQQSTSRLAVARSVAGVLAATLLLFPWSVTATRGRQIREVVAPVEFFSPTHLAR